MNKKYLNEFFSYYSKLNEDQKLAVDTIDGPVLVIAGPGTGKTQVLAIRIANILRLTDVDPSSILCLTFQDASVFAMRERLKRFLGDMAYKIGVYTFHSFCCEIIKNFYYLFDFNPDLEPISDLEKLEIFKEIIEKNNLIYLQTKGDILGHFKEIASKISTLKKEFITPDTLYEKIQELKESPKFKDFSENNLNRLNDFYIFYTQYIQVLQERNLIDFDDMIFKVTDAFIKHEDLVKFYQEKYLYTLVDEFQDTNSAQLEIVKTVGSFEGLEANIFAVGDDDQTIFRFQGASTDNFKKFIDIFPLSKIIILHTNYRSDQEIIDISTNLINNNGNRLVNSELLVKNNLKKDFKSFRTTLSNNPVELHVFDHYWLEDYWISEEINKIVKDGVCKYGDIAIIGRTNRQLLNLTSFFDKVGIPYTFKRTDSVLNDIYIRRLIFLFEALSDPDKLSDDFYLWEILSLDFFNLPPQDVLISYYEARKKKISFFNFLTQNTFLSQSYLRISEVLRKLIDLQSYATYEPFVKVFLKFIDDFEILKNFESKNESVNLMRKLSSLYQYINSRTRFLKKYTIIDFIKEVKIMQDRDLDILIDDFGTDEGDKVNIITAHSSKGLEFEVVFIYQCIENKWEKVRGRGEIIKLPLILEKNVDSNLEKLLNEWDERRLFYVSITRAKRKLYLTYSKTYFENDDGTIDNAERMPSRFISEISLNPNKIFHHPELIKYSDKIRSLIIGSNDKLNIQHLNIDDFKAHLKSLVQDKIVLSYTSLMKYQKCAYKFLLEDIYQVPLLTSVYQLFGIYVHKGISVMYQNLTNLNLFNDSFLIQLYNQLEKELVEEYKNTQLLEKDASLDKLISDLNKALKIYYNYLLDRINQGDAIKVIDSEKRFKAIFNDVPIQGRIDLISNQNGAITITDFKTASKVPSMNEFLGLTKNADLTNLKQLLFYNILFENSINVLKNLPKKIDKLRIEYLDLLNERVDVKEIPASGFFYYKERKNSKTLKEFDVFAVVKMVEDEILDVKKKIDSLNFEKTNDLKNCINCPFRRHCGR